MIECPNCREIAGRNAILQTLLDKERERCREKDKQIAATPAIAINLSRENNILRKKIATLEAERDYYSLKFNERTMKVTELRAERGRLTAIINDDKRTETV
uniref:Uncharacterized protein n=1 Tax=viral metagenome TaxID=1070528 RepID=A0A6M3KUE8_9ZZZZ